jgi:hypothetical protein
VHTPPVFKRCWISRDFGVIVSGKTCVVKTIIKEQLTYIDDGPSLNQDLTDHTFSLLQWQDSIILLAILI